MRVTGMPSLAQRCAVETGWLWYLAMAGQPFNESSDSCCFTMRSAGFVRRGVERSRLGLVLNRLPYAEIVQVVVIALTAKRISAALHTAVITDPRSTITALRHSRLAARHAHVIIREFDLTIHCSASAQASSQCASPE